jgi:transcriptional regulator GlxA family with amidase domain
MSGNSLLVNTALQTLYTNMRYKPTAADLTERVAAAGYQMSDLALIQKLVAKIEAGVDKEGVYLAAGLPVHKVDALFSAFFDNTFAMVSRDVRMTLAKSLLDSGRYASIDDIAGKCGYANATSFRICYKNWFGEYPALTRAKAVKQLFVFD